MSLDRHSASGKGRGDPLRRAVGEDSCRASPVSHPGQPTTDRPAATGAIFLKSSRNPSFEPTHGRKEIHA